MWHTSRYNEDDNYHKLRQNDMSMTQYTHHQRSSVTFQQLVEALQNNTFVTSLKLVLEHIIPIIIECEAKPLLDYIRDSTRLREIELDCSTVRRCPNLQLLAGWILHSIALNDCINSFKLWGGLDILYEPLSRLTTATSSSKLRNLSIHIFDKRGRVMCLHQDVLTRFSANNHTLKYVEINVREETDPADNQSLLHLAGSHEALHTLKISGPPRGYHDALLRSEVNLQIFETLSVLLQVSKSLCFLSVSDFDMTKPCMECLANGLTLCASIESLKFVRCTLDWEASRWFLQFVQHESRRKNTDLELEICNSPHFVQARMDTIVRFISENNDKTTQTLAQPFIWNQSVTLQVNQSTLARALDEFQVKMTNAVQIRFGHVSSLEKCSIDDRKALYTCMPHLIYLQSLTLNNTLPEEIDWPFTMAVRSSGSLTYLFGSRLTSCFESPNTPKTCTLVQAYCQRNKYVPELLSSAALQQASHPTIYQASGEAHTTTTDVTLLVPLLFAVAKQAPRMAPHTIFRALLGGM